MLGFKELHMTPVRGSCLKLMMAYALHLQEAATVMTHLAPRERMAAVEHATKPLYLPFDEFERYLGASFPLPQV